MRRFTCTLVFMFTLSSIFGFACFFTLVFPSENVYVCMRAYMYVYAHTPALQSFYLIIAGRDSLVLLSLDAPLVAPRSTVWCCRTTVDRVCCGVHSRHEMD